MYSDFPNSLSAYDRQRIEIAQQIVERKKLEMDEHLRAACCYGSVAHQASREYSDVEMIIVTDDTIPGKDEQFFEQGIMVECNTRAATRLLRAAEQQVTQNWGIEADQYRHHLVLLDLDDFFPRLWEIARNLPTEAFDAAQPASWWRCYESRNKLRNAAAEQDGPRIRSEGWFFASAAAMHIALHDHRPYESGRTIWQDVVTRGYGMRKLVDILTTGQLEQILPATNEVWEQISQWGVPEEFDAMRS